MTIFEDPKYAKNQRQGKASDSVRVQLRILKLFFTAHKLST